MVSISSLVAIVLVIIVAGLIFALLWWAVRRLPLPEPFRMVADVVLVLAAVLVLVGILLGLIGGLNGQPFFRP